MVQNSSDKKKKTIKPSSGFTLGGGGGDESADQMRARRLAALGFSTEATTATTTPSAALASTNESTLKTAPTNSSGSATTSQPSMNNNNKAKLKKAPPTTGDGKPLSKDWRAWLRLNLARGCDPQVLFDRMMEQGFRKSDVMAVMEEDGRSEIGQDDLMAEATSVWTKTKTCSIPLNNGWKEFIRLKLDKGSSKEEMFLQCFQEGLNLDQVSRALGGYRARPVEESTQKLLPFMKRSFVPRAWKLDTDLVEGYEIPNFLTLAECHEVIQRIETGILQPSQVTNGDVDSRTSHTCHLPIEQDDATGIVHRIEQKLQSLMGHPVHVNAETLQGQRYDVGQFFTAHTDWFTPNTKEYDEHCNSQGRGQRTWTVMVYLNSVEEGGGTRFAHLDREFVPIPGLALVWNNLDADGVTPNSWTLHEAMPVTRGTKYVLTKWCREGPPSG